MNGTQRPRGVMVRTLATGSLERIARQILAAQYDVQEAEACRIYHPLGLLTVRDGREYVLCEEGVGWQISPQTNLVKIPVYPGSMMFTCFVKVSRQVIYKHLTSNETDLADFIRVFGARLEGNFAMWHDMATSDSLKGV